MSFIDEIVKKKAMEDNYLSQTASGQRRFGEGAEIDFKPMTNEAPQIQQAPTKSSGELMSEVAVSGGTGAAMGGPAGAAVAAGGTLLTNIIAQRAADERQRRQNAAAIEQNYAQNETRAYNTILNAIKGATR